MAGINDVKQHISPVTIVLGGQERRLQYDMNAFGELERIYGSIDKAMETMTQGKITDIKNILWAGLIHDQVKDIDPTTGEPIGYNITPYDVGAMITSPAMLPEISIKMAKAFGASLSEEEADAIVAEGGKAAANLLQQ